MKLNITILSATVLSVFATMPLIPESSAATKYRACYSTAGSGGIQIGACFTQAQVGANSTKYTNYSIISGIGAVDRPYTCPKKTYDTQSACEKIQKNNVKHQRR